MCHDLLDTEAKVPSSDLADIRSFIEETRKEKDVDTLRNIYHNIIEKYCRADRISPTES